MQKAIFFLLLAVVLASGCGVSGIVKKPNARRTGFTTLGSGQMRSGEPFGVAVRDRTVYISDGESDKIVTFRNSDAFETFAEGLKTPSQIVFDDKGNLLVADSGSHTIKRISADRRVEILAGIDGKQGFAEGDSKSAQFLAPVGIAFGNGRIFVADTYNDRIRVIDESGQVSTLAGGKRGFADGTGAEAAFDTPCGLAFVNGRLFVADTGNQRIRMVESDGRTTTLAGNGVSDLIDGPLASAAFVQPTAVAVDLDGGILVADGNALRKITSDVFPVVVTINSGKRGFVEGSAKAARLNRPSGIAVGSDGVVYVADSENRSIRVLSDRGPDFEANPIVQTAEEFRKAAPPRWPYDPPTNKREIAGTLGEIRGEITGSDDQVWYHNGLDIVGGYGETARFIRPETVLRPVAAENFGTLRELLRMPTLGYIHIRLGRDSSEKSFGDPRFLFSFSNDGKVNDVRVPRGARFDAGERIGTLNAMNHVHLIAGRSGSEMNALAALELPDVSDRIAPVIEKVRLTRPDGTEFETKSGDARIKVDGRLRIIAKAYDRMDGNADRRRLGVYAAGYQILRSDLSGVGEPQWTIRFSGLPEPESVFLVYGLESHSGATGETIFNYIVTNRVEGQNASEDFIDTATLAPGDYVIRVMASDYFGNTASKDVSVTVGN